MTSTVNPSELLLLPVFFLADAVVRGNLLITWWSSVFLPGALFQGFWGCLLSHSILGAGKVGNVGLSFFGSSGCLSTLLSWPSKTLLWL